MIYNLIETATGRNHSQSSSPILDVKDGYHVVETADNVGIWNELTLQFDEAPIVRRYSKHDFYKKVTHALFFKVVEAAETNIQVKSFLKYIEGMESVRLDDQDLIDGVNLMLYSEVWTQEEVDLVML